MVVGLLPLVLVLVLAAAALFGPFGLRRERPRVELCTKGRRGESENQATKRMHSHPPIAMCVVSPSTWRSPAQAEQRLSVDQKELIGLEDEGWK